MGQGFYGVVIRKGVDLEVLDKQPTGTKALNQARRACDPDDTYGGVEARDKQEAVAKARANREKGYW